MSQVDCIFIAPTRGGPVQAVAAVEALTGGGLVGDRYALPANRLAPDYEVTLVQREHIEAFARAQGLDVAMGSLRRNIVTRGIELNDLVGYSIRIGTATLEGLELCEPCSLLSERVHPAALSFFVGRGGLRARVLVGGWIRLGDVITRLAV